MAEGKTFTLGSLATPVISIGGAIVAVALWGGTMSARLDSTERQLSQHSTIIGHTGMMTLERANAKEVARLQAQMEIYRAEMMQLKRACPTISQKLNPTQYKSPRISNPLMKQTSIP